MYEARSAEYIQIYESIVIEFFLWHKIHKIGAYITRFRIENPNSIIVRMVKPRNISHTVSWLNPYSVPDLATIKNNSRFVDPNLQF